MAQSESPIVQQAHRLGIWFDPLRIARSAVLRWAVICLPLGILAAAAAGYWASTHFKSTYSSTAVIRLVDPVDPPSLVADMEGYKVQQYAPEEVLSWLYSWPLYESLYPISHRDDGIKVLKVYLRFLTAGNQSATH